MGLVGIARDPVGVQSVYGFRAQGLENPILQMQTLRRKPSTSCPKPYTLFPKTLKPKNPKAQPQTRETRRIPSAIVLGFEAFEDEV